MKGVEPIITFDRTESSLLFEQVWRDVKEVDIGRKLPVRSNLDLRKLKKFLPNILIVEVHENAAGFPVRLFGSKLLTLVGQDLTGHDIMELIAGHRREITRQLFSSCVAHPMGIVYFMPVEVPGQLGRLVEVTMLPFETGDGQYQLVGLAQIIDSFISSQDQEEDAIFKKSVGILPLDLGNDLPSLPQKIERLDRAGLTGS